MVTFPERRFPDGHFPGWDNFLWLIYRRTLNMNNTLYLYKFIPRRKANWLALLTPQGYAKCHLLIFHHSSKTNELRNVQSSIKTASVSTFLSWPYLINYRYSVCVVLNCGSSLLLVTTRPTETKSTKSKQRNDNDDRYLILETTGNW